VSDTTSSSLSILQQTWLPNLISVTDDGSAVDYTEVRARFEALAASVGVPTEWVRTVNRGKRHMQGVAIAGHPEADVLLTVDSDTTLDPLAVETARTA
jgi:cellulose synthase/poly-beta-1,6-N-acetylglucosamine synthase-like glycosyltransferase